MESKFRKNLIFPTRLWRDEGQKNVPSCSAAGQDGVTLPGDYLWYFSKSEKKDKEKMFVLKGFSFLSILLGFYSNIPNKQTIQSISIILLSMFSLNYSLTILFVIIALLILPVQKYITRDTQNLWINKRKILTHVRNRNIGVLLKRFSAFIKTNTCLHFYDVFRHTFEFIYL